MPHKKRGHGHHKHPKDDKEQHGEEISKPDLLQSRFLTSYSTTATSSYGKSQPSQATPKPAAQVSTVKPAQFEKSSTGSAMASKPGLVTTTTGKAAAGSGVKGGGSASAWTAGREAPKTRAETNTSRAGATVIDMSNAGSTIVDMTSAGARGTPRDMSKTAPVPKAGATASVPSPAAGAAAAAAAAKPTDSAKSATTAVTTIRAEAAQVDPAKPSKPVAAGNVSVGLQEKKAEAKPTQAKVQVEVPPAAAPAAAKPAKEAPPVDPFDALASILPSADSIAPQQPVYTGPEVTEHTVVSEESEKCGEREDTLPPGYRFEKPPADYKPPPVPKPMSTDEALDSLTAGFMSDPAPKTQGKKGNVDSPCAASAGPTNFAPAPGKKPQSPAAAPPADKKAKIDDFSLEAGLSSSAAAATKGAPVSVCPAAPADKKAKTDDGTSMSLDALSALGSSLAPDVPKPELPELRPEDIVSEDKHKKEEGVFVGERDDTIPPEYRFNEEELKKLPAPKPEPTMNTGDALDILAGDFTSPAVVPPVPAPTVCPFGPPQQKPFAIHPSDLKGAQLEQVAASTAKKVESCSLPPADKKGKGKPAAGKDATDGKPKTDGGAAMPLDALSALGSSLAPDVPKPELPEVRPEDMVSEDKHKKEKGVLVGEDENTIPPEYRFNEEELKKLPAPKPEPPMNTGDALDILTGDLVSSAAAPSVQAPLPQLQTQMGIQNLTALDFLDGDLVGQTTASGVQAPVPPKTRGAAEQTMEQKPVCDKRAMEQKPVTDQGGSMSLAALDALGSSLAPDEPKPELPELRPEDIVSEDKHKKEEGVFVGERDDTIPPEYRFNEEELKKLPAPKPEPTMNTSDALDILSGDFSSDAAAPCVQAPIVQAPVVCPSAPPAQSSEDFALDALAGDFVSSTAAPAVKCDLFVPPETAPHLDEGADNALDALSSTLEDIKPTPQPLPEVPAKDIVNEKKIEEERLIKMGERDDTLPPEYRPTEEDLKKMAEEKAKAATEPKKKTMDDDTALDLLTTDFSAAPAPAVPPCAAGTKLEPPALDSDPLKPMPGPVLDSLSGTLLPDAVKSKTDKPKGKSKSKSKSKKHHAEEPSTTDQLPGKPSSDVVPSSTKKGGRS